jgi:hypothetical protein
MYYGAVLEAKKEIPVGISLRRSSTARGIKVTEEIK